MVLLSFHLCLHYGLNCFHYHSLLETLNILQYNLTVHLHPIPHTKILMINSFISITIDAGLPGKYRLGSLKVRLPLKETEYNILAKNLRARSRA